MTYPDPYSNPVRPSGWKAIARIITEPAAAIADFAGKVPVFPGYLVQMVLGLIALLLSLPATLRITEQMLRNQPGFTEQMVAISKWSGMIGGAIGVLVTPWIAGLIVALLAMFWGQFQEERVPFGSYLGMVGYTRIPVALGSLVGGLLTLVLGDKAATFNLSLAVLAPEGSSVMLKAFLATFTPFDLWYYILLAIGFGALHRGKAAKGAGLAITLYIITLLMALGSAALGSKFGPQIGM